KSGIRADIATTLFGMSPNFDDELAAATEFIKTNKDKNSRIKLRFGPHAPYTCPPDTLSKMVASAKALDVGIHIHLSETQTQVDNSYAASQCTPFEVLNACAGFDVPVIVGHGLWVEHQDLSMLQDKNVYFALCPKTYMKLAMGAGRLWDVHHEIQFSFGTDGAASSNSVNPIEQARLFGLYGKMIGSAADFTIEYLWQKLMADHEALDFNTGKVEVGFDADLLLWDLDKVNTAPVYHPLTSILYSSDASNIKHSLIQGEFVKYDGKIKLDVDDIITKVKAIQRDILKRGKGETKVNY
ncbi:MAG: amidohydrolase family protein, partial [Shewanella sp.]